MSRRADPYAEFARPRRATTLPVRFVETAEDDERENLRDHSYGSVRGPSLRRLSRRGTLGSDDEDMVITPQARRDTSGSDLFARSRHTNANRHRGRVYPVNISRDRVRSDSSGSSSAVSSTHADTVESEPGSRERARDQTQERGSRRKRRNEHEQDLLEAQLEVERALREKEQLRELRTLELERELLREREDRQRNKYSTRSRLRSQRYYSSESESDGIDVDEQAYNFSIPRSDASTFSQPITVKTLYQTEEARTSSPPPSNKGIVIVPETVYGVLESRYCGEGFVGGEHKVSITVQQEVRKSASSLYRWVHLRDLPMNFDNFRNTVINMSGLEDSERTAIAKTLGRVKRKFERPCQMSNHKQARVLDPCILQEEVPALAPAKEPQSKRQKLMFVCMPYFSLQKYSDNHSSVDKRAHHIPTLLQSQSASVDKKRDLQQAVCKLPTTESGLCYHIPQIWYLVLGNSLLVTCSHLPLSEIQGKLISAILKPITEPSRPEVRKVLVSHGTSVLWSFPLNDLPTWFDLMKRFSEFWPMTFQLMYRGKVITPDAWPRLVTRANYTNENLEITLQLSGGEKLRLSGILSDRANILATEDKSNNYSVAMDDQTPTADSLLPPDQNREARLPKKTTTLSSFMDNFFVFPWLSTRNATSGNDMYADQEQMHKDLQAADTFLKTQTDLEESLAYKQCNELPWTDVYSPLRKEADSISEASSKADVKKDFKRLAIHECRVDMFNAAEMIFEFFLPLVSEGPTVGKFWGALGSLLRINDEKYFSAADLTSKSKRLQQHLLQYYEADLREFGEDLDRLLEKVRPFKQLLSQAPLEQRKSIKIPDNFIKSWLHIVMAFVLAAKNHDAWRSHLRTAAKLGYVGAKALMRGMLSMSLLADSVVMPQEIVSLTSLHLLHDMTNDDPQRDIAQIYLEYFSRLRSEIESKPLDRTHQDKITHLKQEIAVVEKRLESQRKIYVVLGICNNELHSTRQETIRKSSNRADDGFTRSGTQMYSKDHYTSRDKYYEVMVDTGNDVLLFDDVPANQSKLSPTDPGGYRDLFVQECLDVLRTKIAVFQEIKSEASDLERWNLRRIETNKDRQESAIYTFTVVTIIFLPLSTVAGILGMNTNDIRNMEVDQWVFWAVAIPVMISIVLLCLIWTGELANFWRGFRFLFRKDDNSIETYQLPYESVNRRHKPKSRLRRRADTESSDSNGSI